MAEIFDPSFMHQVEIHKIDLYLIYLTLFSSHK